jgi:hypothetical protein
MPIHTITLEEKERITGQSANLFKARHQEFYPCVANSDKLISFIESQLGMSILDYPWPLQLEQFEAAYDHIMATSWFYERPVEEEVVNPAVVEEQRKQQQVRDDYDARQRAEQLHIAKTMPLNELRNMVGVGDAAQRAQRSVAARTQDDRQSNRLTQDELNARAAARDAVMLAHPNLNRNGLEFSKKVAEEMAKN